MENSTNERQDNREMDRRTVVLKGAAVAAGALCGASALGLAGCSTPMADAGEQTSMDELMKKMQELEDRLWVAEAKEEIRYKLCMYARGDDRQDAAISKPVYAEDSYVDFGTSPEFGEVFKGSGQEWAEYCANTIDKGITANGGYYAHQMYNIAITVNGTKAGSETYANAPVMSPNEDGTWHVLQTVARYCDKWEYRGGEWVIVERIVTNDFGWHLTSEKLQIPYGCAFDETDPSYGALAYGA